MTSADNPDSADLLPCELCGEPVHADKVLEVIEYLDRRRKRILKVCRDCFDDVENEQ
jgi:hypothetical protein